MAVYFFEVCPGVVKIGHSCKGLVGVRRRLKQARCWCPVVRVLCVLPDADRDQERGFHSRYEESRLAREMFVLTEEIRVHCEEFSEGRDWDAELRFREIEIDTSADRALDARLKQERREYRDGKRQERQRIASEREARRAARRASNQRLDSFGKAYVYAGRARDEADAIRARIRAQIESARRRPTTHSF
jgi:hypothetical protein